jgi:hypothetical protein
MYVTVQGYSSAVAPEESVGSVITSLTCARAAEYVTDALGREVATLADQVSMEAGTHSLPFDAAGIPSGVYLYSLKTKDAVLTRRMVVMK